MTRFVLDASVALSWCFDDEDDAYGRRVLGMLRMTDAIVPAIWRLEVANAVLVAERRRRLNSVDASRFLTLLEDLNIGVDSGTSVHAFNNTLQLARRYRLSAYDAAYLELALREALPIATLDEDLRYAARKLGVDRI
ncbi:MAG: type II toxin-antitoxin system VapC family toxin [Acidobacteriales bacterium]|nr:type II toxin-antitoxin system VapC family toxin [Terriglobales bacterium]